jgi:glutathione synthase/RimK-type ligase-like ATP-grasp enzyme
MTRILIATCAEFPDGEADDLELPGLLGDARFALWDDASADWDDAELVLVRSTWDYSWRRDEFLAWARGMEGRLLNPVDVLEWNSDKTYLADLRSAGLPVVPTLFVPPGGGLPAIESEVVVKPTVSAGSRDTARYEGKDDAGWASLIGAIHRSGRTAMVQPYLKSVDERGETALIYFGGVYDHAIRKGPLLKPDAPPTKDFFAQEDISAREPTPAERAVADRVMSYVGERFGPLAYARVDLVEGPGGGPLLLELELTEPSLFFAHSEGSAARFAAVVLARLA